MSKKGKKPVQPTERPRPMATPVSTVSPTQPVVSTPTAPPVSASTPPPPSDGLIQFDRRVKITLGIFVGLFLLFVLFKWHYISLSAWNEILPDGGPAKRGLVAGTPKRIRMDDYAVGAPWILSNANTGFQTENEAIGGLKTPLMTVPVKHPVTLFKFGHWGFLFLDVERGYSWMYNSSPLILLLGTFLFFLLVTKNQYWLSLTGTLVLFLSSGTVWWSFIPSSMIGYCGAAFVAAVYLLRSRKPTVIIPVAAALIWIAASYATGLYPPYQVPMAYLFIFLLIGYVANERAAIFPLKAVPLKLVSLVGAAALAGVVAYLFKNDIEETIKAVTSTVYPGKRSETGGTGFIANWYSEYYSWFWSDQKFPKGWLNICELSHYLNFAPVIIPLAIALFAFTRRIDWMLVGAMVFVVLMWLWMEVGYPEAIAKATLMSMVPTRRAQIPMGVGGIVLLFLYLGYLRSVDLAQLKANVPGWFTPVAGLGVVAFVIYTASVNIDDSEGLLTSNQVFMPVLFFILMNGLLLFSLNIRYRVGLFCAGIVLFLLPNLKANPLSKGLAPLTENIVYQNVKAIVDRDPNARWVVNGNQFITYMVTATGAKQITGVKYIPNRKQIFSVLDPQMKRDSAYNRYAHVTFQTYINPQQGDTTILAQQYEDGYVIAGDPCSPKFKKLNVKYMLYDHAPQIPYEVRCMKKAVELGSMTIYERVD
ncbi:hypothetical protein FAES_5457 [Fibrella aestuarina BUZ 2]|uniref:Glycosyltransferase RgtA/B/C/D-like domain-containing protein n=1 Tax=Fibrella aestuarina BUZ 2 TaxID=1166018 RepID=I0KH53_9BACT|nr:hypothetical protein [Fibrella aestuarina]CCH03456.1 hypothetical protein FAES_5457 [Fibrella aestuarina BUZ 2]